MCRDRLDWFGLQGNYPCRPLCFARFVSPAKKFTLGLLLSLAALPASAGLPPTTAHKKPAAKAPARPAPKPAGISLPQFTPRERADLAALPPAKPAETALFAYLTLKTGRTVKIPMHPRGVSGIGSWFFSRQTTSHVPAEVYPLLYENLLLAQGLLSSPDISRQRLGLAVARYSEMTARLNLQDYGLDARICEAFLIPHLDIAYPEIGHTVSRRQILEDTFTAFEGTGDTVHQTATLLYLLRYSDSDNTRNWTRTMLAESYEQSGNYGQALAFLKVTVPVDKVWLTRLQSEQKAAQAKKTPLPLPKVITPKLTLPKVAAPKGLHP